MNNIQALAEGYLVDNLSGPNIERMALNPGGYARQLAKPFLDSAKRSILRDFHWGQSIHQVSDGCYLIRSHARLSVYPDAVPVAILDDISCYYLVADRESPRVDLDVLKDRRRCLGLSVELFLSVVYEYGPKHTEMVASRLHGYLSRSLERGERSKLARLFSLADPDRMVVGLATTFIYFTNKVDVAAFGVERDGFIKRCMDSLERRLGTTEAKARIKRAHGRPVSAESANGRPED